MMIELDKEAMVYLISSIQKKSDKVAGLKIQNHKLKKEIKALRMDCFKLEADKETLAKRLTELNHEFVKAKEISEEWERKYFKEVNKVEDLVRKLNND